MNKRAFTMVELIFVIVIIGILASVAVPKFMGVTDGAKKSTELATASAVATTLDSANGEWSINEGDFTWGRDKSSSGSDFNLTIGFPNRLGSSDKDPFNFLIKDSKNFTKHANSHNLQIFTGPASDPKMGVSYPTDATNQDIEGKPDKNDFWVYFIDSNADAKCKIGSKTLRVGDFTLVDVNGTSPTDYSSLTCN